MDNLKEKAFLFVFIAMVLFSSRGLMGQTPTTGDCLGATPVCQDVYYEPNIANGPGNYTNEIHDCPQSSCQTCCPGSCLNGEWNTHWYRFTVQTTGLLRLSIIPNVPSDDYDWALFDLTFKRCENILTQYPTMQKSCNAAGGSGYQGETGISSSSGGTSHCNNCGGTNKWNVDLPVEEGRTYVLMVDNWGSGAQGGYTLDFSASTAEIFDNVRPELQYVNAGTIECGDDEFTFDFSEMVRCVSVLPTSLQVVGPDTIHALIDITGEACEVGGEWEVTYTATVDPPFTVDGDYYLEVLPFTSIQDACNNIALPQQLPFTCDLGAPDILEGQMTITHSSCGQENGSITGIEVSGNGPFEYEWHDQDYNLVGTELDLTDIPAGQYTLTVDDPAGCQSIGGPYQVNDEGAPLIDDSQMVLTDNTCGDDNGRITGLDVTGTEPFVFEWYDENNNLVASTLDLLNRPGGEYRLKIIDDNNCESFAGPFVIIDQPSPQVYDGSMIISGENCGMQNGLIADLVVTGSTALNYRWYNTAGDTIGYDVNLTGVQAGTYTLLIRDENGCVTLAGPYDVPDVPGPEINFNNLEVNNARCGEINGSIQGLVITGNSGLIYRWEDETGSQVGDTSFLTGIGPGIYTLTVTDAAGCESFAGPYEIINVGGVSISATIQEDPTCELANGQITITAAGSAGGIFYSIDNGITWHNDNYFQNLMSGTYHIFVKDTFDCVSEYSGNPIIMINHGEAIHVLAEGETPLCTGDNLQLMVDYSGATYTWMGPDGFSSSEQNPLIPGVGLEAGGTYTVVVVTSPYACKDTSEIEIQVIESFPLELGLSVTKNPIYPAESVSFMAITSTPGINPTYEWLINGQVFQSGTDSTFTTNEITASTEVVCRLYVDESCADPNPATAVLNIQVLDILIYFPNSFKPSSTQGNHIFKAITTSTNVPGYELIIFNRWGQQIFQTKDLEEGWDGTIEGEQAPEGVYVWMISYEVADESFNIRKEKKKGTVLLLH